MAYRKNVTANDFPDGELIIPFEDHQTENPIVESFENDGDWANKIGADVSINKNFDVKIGANGGFDGFVMIS